MGLFIAIVSLGAISTAAVALFGKRRLRSAGTTIGMRTVVRRMLLGRGYMSVSAAELHRWLENPDVSLSVVDLRDGRRFDEGSIDGAVSRPMDDFLRDVVVDGVYDDARDQRLVLVCDHGHLSRVAGAILAEDEGFTQVYNLRGGIAAWDRLSDGRRQRCCSALLERCCAS